MHKKTPAGCKDLKKKFHKETLNWIKKLELPKPDHPYGYSMHLLQNSISSREFETFNEWMYGQTGILDAKLGFINYTDDVIRGIRLIRNGTLTYWD